MGSVLNLLWVTLAIYIALGITAAIFFHLRGLPRLDSAVAGAGWFFRVLITPGIIGLWPVLLRRLASDKPPVPTEPVPPRRLRAVHGAFAVVLAVLLPILVGIALIYREGVGQ